MRGAAGRRQPAAANPPCMHAVYCNAAYMKGSVHGGLYGLDLPTSSTRTGMRGAAGGRQPAAANPPCMHAVYCNAAYMKGFVHGGLSLPCC